VSPATQPPPRMWGVMVYDEKRGVHVLFGGSGGGAATMFNDTWEYDGITWTKKNPANSPPARAEASAVFDSTRNVVVLFGGSPTPFGAYLNDTWEYDGVNWVQRMTATTPPARRQVKLAYDSYRKLTVMFGGYSNAFLGDTWEYNGTNWVQRLPPISPSVRSLEGLVFDGARKRVFLFGGVNSPSVSFSCLSDSWTYPLGRSDERIGRHVGLEGWRIVASGALPLHPAPRPRTEGLSPWFLGLGAGGGHMDTWLLERPGKA
jgi:hypothetical protein